jgi:hypothetical protein
MWLLHWPQDRMPAKGELVGAKGEFSEGRESSVGGAETGPTSREGGPEGGPEGDEEGARCPEGTRRIVQGKTKEVQYAG